MKRGICFTAVGDKAAEGITDDRKSMEERRRHREMRDEMKKKSGAMVMEISGIMKRGASYSVEAY